jgi:hypothetical protein
MGWLLGWMGSRRRWRVINAAGGRLKIESLKGVSSTYALRPFRPGPNCSECYNCYNLKTMKMKKEKKYGK